MQLIKPSILALLTTSICLGQVTISAPTTTLAGKPITVTINNGATATIGLQWTAIFPVGTTVTGIAAGSKTTSSNKQLACSASNLLCLVYGFNNTVIAPGDVATYVVTLPNSVAPLTLSLAGILGATATGLVANIPATTSATITILKIQDLNSDGVVNLTDVSLAVDQARGITPCTNADVNGDGVCNIFDVVNIVLTALGIIGG